MISWDMEKVYHIYRYIKIFEYLYMYVSWSAATIELWSAFANYA